MMPLIKRRDLLQSKKDIKKKKKKKPDFAPFYTWFVDLDQRKRTCHFIPNICNR